MGFWERRAGRTAGRATGRIAKPEDLRQAARRDSGIEAIVTLLATVVFGLGWTLVELERAGPAPNGYAAATSERAIAADDTLRDPPDRWKYEDAGWTERAQRRSKR